MMVVVAIIGIMAAIAVQVASGQNQSARLNQSATDVQSQIGRARAEAVRTGVLQKVCLFADPNAKDSNPYGVLLRFRCFSAGDTACDQNGGTICSNVDATSTTKYNTLLAGCVAGQWCHTADPTEELDFSSVTANTHSSLMGFVAAPRATPPPTSPMMGIELTFNALGIIDPRRSTAGYLQGSIFVTSFDFCSPGIPPAGTCSTIKRYLTDTYVLGGNIQVTR